MSEVAIVRYSDVGAGLRSLAAFREAGDRRGYVPEGVSWSGGVWSDGWSVATASSHLLRRHLRNTAIMFGAPEQPAVRHTPEVEREIAEYLRRKHQRDERLRDRIREAAV